MSALVRLFRTSIGLRFVLVGAFNTAGSYAAYALLILAGLPFPLANFGALLFGIGLSFVTQGRIVFGDADPRRLPRFILAWLAIYLAQTGAIALLVMAGLSALLAGLILLPLTAFASFVVQRRLVFSPMRTERSGG